MTDPTQRPADPAASSETDAQVMEQITRRTRRSFLVAGAAAATTAIGLRIYDHRPRQPDILHRPMRTAEEFNRVLAENVIGETTLARTYPQSQALANPRPNGAIGIRRDLNPASWRLQVTGLADSQRHPQYVDNVSDWKYEYATSYLEAALQADGEAQKAGDNNKLSKDDAGVSLSIARPPAPGLLLTLAEIQALPFVQQTTEFKCIEGWSELVSFGGVRFRDFLALYPPFRNPDGSLPRYAAMTTPDGSFSCGFDMASLQHPQTLLCFQMSGRDLLPAHGAPLRLAMPLKYGYKQIKQIGRISYTNDKPSDYFASFGFDWHGGL